MEFLVEYYLNVNLQLGRNTNSPPSACFQISKYCHVKLKLNKAKMAMQPEPLFEFDVSLKHTVFLKQGDIHFFKKLVDIFVRFENVMD